ncbi:hypothetical protein Plhal304r1_c058g0144861 [Plasmopara halstedii]
MFTNKLQRKHAVQVSVLENLTINASVFKGGKDDIDFDAIRAEYERCVTECNEAQLHISRLSNEVAELEKLLPLDELVEGGS